MGRVVRESWPLDTLTGPGGTRKPASAGVVPENMPKS
jgi:hypothetical protein